MAGCVSYAPVISASPVPVRAMFILCHPHVSAVPCATAVRVVMTSQTQTGDDSGLPADRARSMVLESTLARFHTAVMRAGQARGLRGDDLDEVLQDVRIRLWRASATVAKVETLTVSYVYRTASSAALDVLRRQRARREQSLSATESGGVPQAPAPNADRALISGEVVAAIAATVGELAPNRRAVVRMYLAGYDRDEISVLLSWSEAKTRNLLYRGLDDLRALLTARGIGPESVT